MKLEFSKMHGLGNDFLVINAIKQTLPSTHTWIKRLACRHRGIGFDQCLVLEPSKRADVDFFYRIFNADGSEVGQCGNGARCLALFIKHQQLSMKSLITVETHSTRMELRLNDDASVTVHMESPQFEPQAIPLLFDHQQDSYPFEVDGDSLKLHAVNVGNPHGVLCVNDLAHCHFEDLAAKLSTHPLFPEQANISFMQIFDKGHITLRVYERGSGETLACGSAAAAAAAIAIHLYDCNPSINITLPGGQLHVHWEALTAPLALTGPASHVFDGVVSL